MLKLPFFLKILILILILMLMTFSNMSIFSKISKMFTQILKKIFN